MINSYKIVGDVAIITLPSKTHGDKETIISSERLHFIRTNVLRVGLRKASNTFYAVCKVNDGRSVDLHRVLKGEPIGLVVDHKDRNGLNNTDDNLRTCTYSDNSTNKSVQSNSKTGIRGVRFAPDSSGKPWKGEVRQRNGKGKYIHHLNKRFATQEEAEQAVIETRKKVFPFDATIR